MINWGILGLGRMGSSFAAAINETSNSKLISTASKSGKSIENNKIIKKQNYEELINDKNIDAVYVSTLNHTHAALIKELSKARKNILCEKPITTNSKDAAEIKKIIKDCKISFFEAIAYYSHPQTIELQKIINRNEIGKINKIESSFGFKVKKVDPSSRLFNKDFGGGAILDVGCYPLSFLMLFTNNLNDFEFKSKNLSFSSTKVDDHAEAKIVISNAIEANIEVSLKKNLDNSTTLYGSEGKIKISNPWLPEKKSTIEMIKNKQYYKQFVSSKLSIYANQIQNVSEVFLNKKKIKNNLFDIDKSVVCMSLIEKWKSNSN